ncbi:MAG: DUF937 domain-containing protein [Brachymonas sp.]|nr:DUF937 domain-containing protein [Brachymonas sp.]
MSLDLTNLLQEKVGQTLTRYLTDQLSESPSVASRAVSLALPALLGGLLKNTGDSNKMTDLFNLVTGPRIDSNLASTTTVDSSLLDLGRGLLSNVFGDSNWLSNLLANKTGMSSNSAGNLLAAGLPLLLGTLRKQVQDQNLTQPQFVSLLSDQKSFLAKLLDGDFLNGLGLGAIGATLGKAADSLGDAAEDVVKAAVPSNGMSWLWPIIAAIGTALVVSMCTGKNYNAPVPTPAPVPAASEPAAAASKPASASVDADAGSVKYENGVMSVYFGTGKTDFDTATAKTLAAELIQKAKDGAKLGISGYNDPRGDAALNAELSKNRAKAVEAFLLAEGIAEGNLELIKPAETDGNTGSLAEDRRVDVYELK